jgi:hypothetical protein
MALVLVLVVAVVVVMSMRMMMMTTMVVVVADTSSIFGSFQTSIFNFAPPTFMQFNVSTFSNLCSKQHTHTINVQYSLSLVGCIKKDYN